MDKAPGIKRGLTALVRSMEAEAGDPHYGKTLKSYLEASKELSEVNVREVELPVNPIPAGMCSRCDASQHIADGFFQSL